MKNKIIYIITIVLFLLMLPIFMGNSPYKQPNEYYQVYIDGNYIGTITSEAELKKYINIQTDTIRENIRIYKLRIDAINSFDNLSVKTDKDSKKDAVYDLLNRRNELELTNEDVVNLELYKSESLYELSETDITDMRDYVEKNDIYLHTNEVYVPNGIDIKKVYTYNDKVYSIKDIYKKIMSEKACTIAGYKFTIKSISDSMDDINIYTLDKEIFYEAIDRFIKIFLSEEDYEAYKTNNQSEIATTGSIIEKVYIEQPISYKATNVSVEEKVYINSSELADFLLYGPDNKEAHYVTVKTGDTIESIADENKISIQEILISNPQYTSKENLIAQGSLIKIATINPRIQVVVEKYEVYDQEIGFTTIERYDETENQGKKDIIQVGEKGLERITQNVKIINGMMSYVSPLGKTVIKSSVPEIISIGTKYIPNVGSLASWGWPTTGYAITSYWGWRPPVPGVYDEPTCHSGVDIAPGFGQPIYASNNGVVEYKGWQDSYGNIVTINHNNGYYTAYAHMSSFADISVGETVTRGQVIGYIGMTGSANGPHVHFEIRKGCNYYGCDVNPKDYLGY